MSHPIRKFLSRGFALGALVALTSCGGGSDSEGQQLPQAIGFGTLGNQIFGVAPLNLLAVASSSLPVTLQSTTPAVCTVTGAVLTVVAAGTCSVTASQAGNEAYAAAAPVTVSFAVAPAAQTITFPTPGNQTLGTAPGPLMGTASSGLAVSFSSSTPAVCTVNGTALSLVGIGTCTVTARQAGNANFRTAPDVSYSVTVATVLLTQSIDFPAPANQTLTVAPAPLAATATSGLVISLTSMTPSVCTVSSSTLALVSAGTCTVAASQAGTSVYAAATTVSRSFPVARAAQTLSFTAVGNQTLGTAPPALVASSSAGLSVALTSTAAAVCTVSGNTVTLMTAGTCSIDANQAGNATYNAAATVTRSFTVAAPVMQAQTIAFAAPGNQTLGTAPLALVATASSGLAVSFASTTPSTCTVSGSTLTLLAVGTCIIDASQAGNSGFSAATPVSRVITIAAAPLSAQTISFTSPGNQTLGTAPPLLMASASSGLAVSFASTTPSTCTVNGSTLTLLAVGTCIIDASQAGNSSFAAATTVSRVITIASAPLTAQTISFTQPGNQTLGTAPPALMATASSGLAVSFTSTTPGTCTVSGSALNLVAVGTCIIDARQAGNSSFAAAITVSRAFTIAAAPLTAQTITFNSPGNQTLGGAPLALLASASSGLAVSFASTSPGVCTVNGTTLTLVAAGTCNVDANQAGNGVFSAATTVSRTITVSVAPLTAQTIAFNSPGNQTLGTAPPTLSATASSGLTVGFASTTASVCTVNGPTLTLFAVGICIIDASQPGNSTFAAAATVSRSFTVSAAPPAAQTVTFNSPGNQTLGTAPPALVATASSGLPVTFTSTMPSVCMVSGTALTLVAVGTCVVDANQAGNSIFAPATTVSRSFTVSAAPPTAQTITFNSPGNQTLGTAPPVLVATASSGLTVSFASTTPSICTVTSSALTLLAVGTCIIDASQAGNSTIAAATTVSRSFTVSVAPPTAQTITFNSPGNQTLGTAPPVLVATASSGLTVSFASTTPSICTVSGSTLTLVAAGTCIIDASQAGNSIFAPATTVSRVITVAAAPPASQIITFNSPGIQTLVLNTAPPETAPAALVASASSGLAVSFASITPSICTVSGPALLLHAVGSCSITASQAGNGSFAAATPVSVTFGVAYELFGNGGFEIAGATTPANAWLSAAAGYSLSSDARSGAFSARLSSPAFNAAVMLQNSVEQGGRAALVVGSSPTLTFWAKGTAGGTGNVLFALRYLDGVGNIRANSLNQFFQGSINPNTWTLITYNLGVVPAGAVAAFIEFSQAIGPIDGSNPAGVVLIDDLSLKVQ